MTRQELIERLRHCLNGTRQPALRNIIGLIEDIEEDGVLDVQAPPDIADSMSLPQAQALYFNQGLEAAANLCASEASLRRSQARRAEAGDKSWGIDTKASAMAQYHKAVTADALASQIRELMK